MNIALELQVSGHFSESLGALEKLQKGNIRVRLCLMGVMDR